MWLISNRYFVKHVLPALDVDVDQLLLTRVEQALDHFALEHLEADCLANLDEAKHDCFPHVGVLVAHLLRERLRKRQQVVDFLAAKSLALR